MGKDVVLKITPFGHNVVPGAYEPVQQTPFGGLTQVEQEILRINKLQDEVHALPLSVRMSFIKEVMRRTEAEAGG